MTDTAGTAYGEPSSEYAYDFFTAAGLSGPQAAGVIGNLEQESSTNLDAEDNGPSGEGIAQWIGDRAEPGLVTGNYENDLTSQLEYIWETLPSEGLSTLETATTPDQAAADFSNDFERDSTYPNDNRNAYADQTYAAAQSGDWGLPAGSTAESVNATATGSTETSGGETGNSTGTTQAQTFANTLQSSPGSGFLNSFNTSLNPSKGLNPFNDVEGSIDMAIVRGGLALFGLFICLMGVSLIVIGIAKTGAGKNTVGVAKTAAKAAIL